MQNLIRVSKKRDGLLKFLENFCSSVSRKTQIFKEFGANGKSLPREFPAGDNVFTETRLTRNQFWKEKPRQLKQKTKEVHTGCRAVAM